MTITTIVRQSLPANALRTRTCRPRELQQIGHFLAGRNTITPYRIASSRIMLTVSRKTVLEALKTARGRLSRLFSTEDNGRCDLLLQKPLARLFGPATTSSVDLKEVVGHSCTAERVGVVRRAFLADEPEDSFVDDPSASRMSRTVVDEYVLDHNSNEYRLVLSDATPAPVSPSQSTNEVLMVAPTAFTFNASAAEDNAFMNVERDDAPDSMRTQVLREFSKLYGALVDDAGVTVRLFQHGERHNAPDSCFPNNWFSTHAASEAEGDVGVSTLVYYPMKCENRRNERRADVKAVLEQVIGFDRIVDLSGEEANGRFFEGTGSLVLDRVHGIAYVALSERADRGLAERWVRELGYRELVAFHSVDDDGHAVYHTNVMMAVGTSVAVVCLESVTDAAERRQLTERLLQTHAIVDITLDQMKNLCGNCLEVRDRHGRPVMAMSTRAYDAFRPEQRAVILEHVHAIVHAPIDMLEHVGGGGVRCTLAEIFR